MLTFQLSEDEAREVHDLASSAARTHRSIDNEAFLAEATTLAHRLPARLRTALNNFRLHDDGPGVLHISGYRLDPDKIGPTPPSWDVADTEGRTLSEEIYLALCGSLLGDLISWASEQDGHLAHNVLPIVEHEQSQLGWGSAVDFILHVEDAFSQYPPDYLGLMCMRNPDRIGTTFSSVSKLNLDELNVATLRSDSFFVRPDDAHLEESDRKKAEGSGSNASLQKRIAEVADMKKVPILSGDVGAPYICLDPPYMVAADTEKAQPAFEQLLRMLDYNKQSCRLDPGDIMLIDNCRAVHGREAFQARYDGTDRWLKRIKVTRDLRRSRSARSSAASRLIG